MPTKQFIEAFRKAHSDYFKWLTALSLFLLTISLPTVTVTLSKHPLIWKPLFYEGWFFMAQSIMAAISLLTMVDFYTPLRRIVPDNIWKFHAKALKNTNDGKLLSWFLKYGEESDTIRFLYLAYFFIGFDSLFVACIKNLFTVFSSE